MAWSPWRLLLGTSLPGETFPTGASTFSDLLLAETLKFARHLQVICSNQYAKHSDRQNMKDTMTGRRFAQEAKKEKVKTRPAVVPPAQHNTVREVPEAPSSPRLTQPIPVKGRIYDVLEVIFGDGRHGQISFEKLQKALLAIGYTSQKKKKGSRFIFTSPGRPSLHCHVNHGGRDCKMDRGLTANIARDLAEASGWSMESFEILANG